MRSHEAAKSRIACVIVVSEAHADSLFREYERRLVRSLRRFVDILLELLPLRACVVVVVMGSIVVVVVVVVDINIDIGIVDIIVRICPSRRMIASRM